MAAAPWTDADDAHLTDLHAADTPTRAMGAALGRTRSSVDRRLRHLGLGATTRLGTMAATAANMTDAKARRSQATLNELEILELSQARSLGALRGTTTWSTIMRGAEGREDTREIAFVPPRDLREETSARAAMSTIIARLDTSETEFIEEKSVLSVLMDGLRAAHAASVPTPRLDAEAAPESINSRGPTAPPG